MIKQAYWQGFSDECRRRGVDPRALVKFAQQTNSFMKNWKLDTSSNPTLSGVNSSNARQYMQTLQDLDQKHNWSGGAYLPDNSEQQKFITGSGSQAPFWMMGSNFDPEGWDPTKAKSPYVSDIKARQRRGAKGQADATIRSGSGYPWRHVGKPFKRGVHEEFPIPAMDFSSERFSPQARHGGVIRSGNYEREKAEVARQNRFNQQVWPHMYGYNPIIETNPTTPQGKAYDAARGAKIDLPTSEMLHELGQGRLQGPFAAPVNTATSRFASRFNSPKDPTTGKPYVAAEDPYLEHTKAVNASLPFGHQVPEELLEAYYGSKGLRSEMGAPQAFNTLQDNISNNAKLNNWINYHQWRKPRDLSPQQRVFLDRQGLKPGQYPQESDLGYTEEDIEKLKHLINTGVYQANLGKQPQGGWGQQYQQSAMA